jgi:trehalose 6-phosphate synthase
MQVRPRDAAPEIGDTCRDVLGGKRLILVSNRGPVEYRSSGDGWEAHPGCGGVATALSAVARRTPLTWVTSAITEGDRVVAESTAQGHIRNGLAGTKDCRVRFVVSPQDAYELHYNLISNPVLWFLHHSLWKELDRPGMTEQILDGWDYGYQPVNRHFARAILAEMKAPDSAYCVMFHDYHLYLAPLYVRTAQPYATLTHFVHIPWPEPQAWRQLPDDISTAICRGLLANDVVAFQTSLSALNFLRTCESILKGARVNLDAATVAFGGRETAVRHRPISVDVADLERRMDSPEVKGYQARLASLCGKRTIVRVDRLDPGKNVVGGFHALDMLLRRHPELLGQVKVLAFLVPSRTSIPEYKRYKRQVFDRVAEINQRYGADDWRPIEVFYENNYAQALAGMSLADVLLINPLADGMNLVSKESAIVNRRGAVLVLSRKAGSHAELAQGALSIDPTDFEGTAQALEEAIRMPPDERYSRAHLLRRIIERNDLSVWLRSMLEDLRVPAQEPSFAVARRY